MQRLHPSSLKSRPTHLFFFFFLLFCFLGEALLGAAWARQGEAWLERVGEFHLPAPTAAGHLRLSKELPQNHNEFLTKITPS